MLRENTEVKVPSNGYRVMCFFAGYYSLHAAQHEGGTAGDYNVKGQLEPSLKCLQAGNKRQLQEGKRLRTPNLKW